MSSSYSNIKQESVGVSTDYVDEITEKGVIYKKTAESTTTVLSDHWHWLSSNNIY